MNVDQNINSDKEYILLSEIEDRQDISQRELAQVSGISLGTVNLLLKKMIKRGLVKMETIPANRVVYMLTPAGMAEKARKTVSYVKIYYRVINKTKQRIKLLLIQLHQQYDVIYIRRSNDELDTIIETAIHEYHDKNSMKIICMIDESSAILEHQQSELSKSVFLYIPEDVLDGDLIERKYLLFDSKNLLEIM